MDPDKTHEEPELYTVAEAIEIALLMCLGIAPRGSVRTNVTGSLDAADQALNHCLAFEPPSEGWGAYQSRGKLHSRRD